MRKKTRYKLKSNLLLPFIFAVYLSACGAAISGLLFYNSFFRSLSKVNEEPIATITFKYKTAERKFLERVVWDRLRQNSPLYNGDTVRTENLSEATVYFTDGNILDLSENSMAQVFLNADGGAGADIGMGSATVDSVDSKNGMTITSGSMTVAVSKGSSVSAGNNQMQVLKGTADVKTKDGELSVTQGEGLAVQNGGLSPKFVVTSPAPSSKVLYFDREGADIPFKWTVMGDAAQADLSLEIAMDKNFSSIVYSSKLESISSLNEFPVKLSAGNYYWRVTDAEQTLEASSRLQVIQSLRPELLAPSENYSYYFRSKLPAVRLIWTESPLASVYRLEVSSTPDFSKNEIDLRTASTSAIVSTLKAGKYYWRVTPYYTVNRIGFAQSGEVKSFLVSRKESLSAPGLLIPEDNSFVDTDETAPDVNFSWRADSEASLYTVTLSRDENLSSRTEKIETSSNYWSLPKSKSLADGKWYWAVTMTDGEGNKSPISEIRSFTAMRGVPEIHTVEPADHYGIAQNLLPDMNFTWKKKLPEGFTSELQISRDENFTQIVSSFDAEGTSVKVKDLDLGEYYWRLVSENGDLKMETPAKEFEVLPSLPPSRMINPLDATRVSVSEGEPYTMAWEPVANADYYKIKILRQDGLEVFQDIIDGNQLKNLNMTSGGFEDKKKYSIEIQAFSNAIPGVVSRRTGMLMTSSFTLRHIHPVQVMVFGHDVQGRLIRLQKNDSIQVLDAIKNPLVADWDSGDPTDEIEALQLVVRQLGTYTREGKKNIYSSKKKVETVFSSSGKIAGHRIKIDTKDGLEPGRYEILIPVAWTVDGFDISNGGVGKEEKRAYFTILPEEPLDEPVGLEALPKIFDGKYLKDKNNPRSITLSWNEVDKKKSQTVEYKVSVADQKGTVVREETVYDGTSYIIDVAKLIDDDSDFEKGKFKWTVQAIGRYEKKSFQQSPVAVGEFETDIPVPKKAKTKKLENPYGL